ncbi:MAG: YmaF family protein, partial [Thermosediminibacteraceae bacterium]|nr:YmaF family protein [Thermosediminibacteraceae bacterium]
KAHYSHQHYHEICGMTTFNEGHFHFFKANTGISIPLPNGYHTHYFSFRTSFNEGHDHEVTGFVEAIKD